MLGNAGFDPWGLSTPQNIKWMREAELKHGRMCQLAWLGYVAVDLGIKFPGEKYAALSSFTAHEGTATYELFFLLLWVGTFETIGFSQIYGMCADGSDRQPGDFGFDPLGLLTPETDEQYRTAELIHGRLAMLAFSAVVTQSALGKPDFPCTPRTHARRARTPPAQEITPRPLDLTYASLFCCSLAHRLLNSCCIWCPFCGGRRLSGLSWRQSAHGCGVCRHTPFVGASSM